MRCKQLYNTKIVYISLLFLLFTFCFDFIAYAALTAQQQVSGQERTREIQEEQKELEKKLEKKKEAPKIEEEYPPQPPAPPSIEKILIKNIKISGVTLISEKDIDTIIENFKSKELNLAEMQKVADEITALYRQKGYITSRAYLPPQKIENGVLEILVIEGMMGDVEVKGNRYFSTEILLSYITLKKNNPFNYNILRKDLAVINQSPDRLCRAVLVPGKERGRTDTVLEVKDRLPIHISLDWDNYGSRYIERQRYSATVTHNNLLGLDDSLSFQYQLAEANKYALRNLRYLLPLNSTSQLGFFASISRVRLGREFEDLFVIGRSRIYGLFLTNALIKEENINLSLNFGFDYKDVKNYQLNTLTSYDRLRVAKTGLEIDLTDSLGRTLITDELDFGIPHIMGGLAEKDAKASRAGAGGKFHKNTVNLLRLQKMPFNSTLLWKNQAQTSPYVLAATEQFQIGGVANVRGYPTAEAVGDSGYATTLEVTVPPYFVPKGVRLPFLKDSLYDVFRAAVFYDWANVHLKNPAANEEKNKTLRGFGWGARLNFVEDFYFKIDFAWPLDNKPSDGNSLHTWAQVSKTF